MGPSFAVERDGGCGTCVVFACENLSRITMVFDRLT